MKRHLRTTAAALTGSGLLAFSALAAVAASPAGAATPRTAIGGTALPASAHAQPVSPVAAASTISFDAVLKLRDAAGASALVKAVSDPQSSSFRRYLTAARWETRFSPTTASVNTVRSWLSSQGFKVGTVSADRTTVSATGSAAQVEKAFATSLNNYKLGGKIVRYASTNLSLPTSVAGSVEGITGINQHVMTPTLAAQAGATSPSSAAGAAQPAFNFPPPPPPFIRSLPCATYYGQASTATTFGNQHPGYNDVLPDQVCGYTPSQLRSAYGMTAAATGKGTTVAVVLAYDSANIEKDATTFFAKNDASNPFAKADLQRLDFVPFDQQTTCDASSWLEEQALDIESVHGMAPNAHVVYVGAQDCLDPSLLAAVQLVVDNHLADVVTDSWGDNAGDLLEDSATRTAYDDEFMLAASTGMSVLFSSGDDGDNFDTVGLSSADYPPSSPFVTAVGGTSLEIGSAGQQTGQPGWSTGRSFLCTPNLIGYPGCTSATLGVWLTPSLDGASGGFTSYDYAQPWYQAPIVPTALSERNVAFSGAARVEPDISMDADPATGPLIGFTATFPNGQRRYSQTRIGGTSASSPLLAGVIADADQKAGVAVGFLNPAIYHLDQTNPAAIQDILPATKQAQYRVDYEAQLFVGGSGRVQSVRVIDYAGPVSYCDGTGNCEKRPMTLTAAKGFDSLTGLGSIGPSFVTALAKS